MPETARLDDAAPGIPGPSPAPADGLDAAIDQNRLLWAYLNNTATASLLVDPAGTVSWASPSVRSMLGRSAESLLGSNVADLIDPTQHDALLAQLRAVASGLSSTTDTICAEVSNADGMRFWTDIDLSFVPGGATPTALVTLRDASARMAGTAALRTSEQRFRSIVNEAPVGIGLQDTDGNLVFMNSRLKRILGTGANYLLWAELVTHVHRSDLELVGPRRAGDDDERDQHQIRFIRPDGEMRWCTVRMLPQHDHNGALTNQLWAVQDVTARVRAEEDQARLYGLMEASSDLVAVIDPTAVALYLNPAARRFLAIDPDLDLSRVPTPVDVQVEPPELWTEIRARLAATETWQGELVLKTAFGRSSPFSAMIVPHVDHNGRLDRVSAVLRDVTERKEFERRLEWEATHDPLTELPNRVLLTKRQAEAMDRAANDGTVVAVAFLDLDNFRVINESLGHRVGDDLLVQTARKLRDLVWSHDLVARFGADEFALLLEQLHSPGEAEELTERIRTAVSGRVGMAEVELLMTFSAGVATAEPGQSDAASLLRDANAALHEAKSRGRDRTTAFSGAMRTRAFDRLNVETGLRRALRRGEFRLHYQPQIDLATGRICGAEALVRWQDPDRGLVSPNEFIPIAEQSGLVLPIGSWVLEEACHQLASWAHELPRGERFAMGINLSGAQLMQASLIEEIGGLIERTGVDPANLEMEITESILLDDVERSISVLEQLKSLGVQLSLDDFGTGYSSLTYLRSFPIDVVKIDRSFVDGIGADPGNAAIVRSVVDLAQTLGLRCIAEGVETEEDLAELRRLHCDMAQGFLIARPLAAPDATRFISYDPTW